MKTNRILRTRSEYEAWKRHILKNDPKARFEPWIEPERGPRPGKNQIFRSE